METVINDLNQRRSETSSRWKINDKYMQNKIFQYFFCVPSSVVIIGLQKSRIGTSNYSHWEIYAH